MRPLLQTKLGKHGLGIVACSVAAFLFIVFVTSVGWGVGDARSGDVVRSESSFSPSERICFEVSRAMTVPVRWFIPSNSTSTTAAVAVFSMLSLAWGIIGYLSVVLLVRTARGRSSRARS